MKNILIKKEEEMKEIKENKILLKKDIDMYVNNIHILEIEMKKIKEENNLLKSKNLELLEKEDINKSSIFMNHNKDIEMKKNKNSTQGYYNDNMNEYLYLNVDKNILKNVFDHHDKNSNTFNDSWNIFIEEKNDRFISIQENDHTNKKNYNKKNNITNTYNDHNNKDEFKNDLNCNFLWRHYEKILQDINHLSIDKLKIQYKDLLKEYIFLELLVIEYEKNNVALHETNKEGNKQIKEMAHYKNLCIELERSNQELYDKLNEINNVLHIRDHNKEDNDNKNKICNRKGSSIYIEILNKTYNITKNIDIINEEIFNMKEQKNDNNIKISNILIYLNIISTDIMFIHTNISYINEYITKSTIYLDIHHLKNTLLYKVSTKDNINVHTSSTLCKDTNEFKKYNNQINKTNTNIIVDDQQIFKEQEFINMKNENGNVKNIESYVNGDDIYNDNINNDNINNDNLSNDPTQRKEIYYDYLHETGNKNIIKNRMSNSMNNMYDLKHKNYYNDQNILYNDLLEDVRHVSFENVYLKNKEKNLCKVKKKKKKENEKILKKDKDTNLDYNNNNNNNNNLLKNKSSEQNINITPNSSTKEFKLTYEHVENENEICISNSNSTLCEDMNKQNKLSLDNCVKKEGTKIEQLLQNILCTLKNNERDNNNKIYNNNNNNNNNYNNNNNEDDHNIPCDHNNISDNVVLSNVHMGNNQDINENVYNIKPQEFKEEEEDISMVNTKKCDDIQENIKNDETFIEDEMSNKFTTLQYISRSIKVLKEERDNIQNKYDILKQQNGVIQNKYDILKEQNGVIQNKFDILKDEKDKIQKQNDILTNKCNELQNQCCNNLTGLQNVTKKYDDLQNKYNILNKLKNSLEEKNEELKKYHEHVIQERDQLIKEKESDKQEIEYLKNNVDVLKIDKSNYMIEKNDNIDKIKKLEEEKKKLEVDINNTNDILIYKEENILYEKNKRHEERKEKETL
ncbi:hypothetical protein PFTANZ_06360, partial [Plasmodium falciparum Tanzania (2000708)]